MRIDHYTNRAQLFRVILGPTQQNYGYENGIII